MRMKNYGMPLMAALTSFYLSACAAINKYESAKYPDAKAKSDTTMVITTPVPSLVDTTLKALADTNAYDTTAAVSAKDTTKALAKKDSTVSLDNLENLL